MKKESFSKFTFWLAHDTNEASPFCVTSRPPPGRQPVAVSTVWHWRWTLEELLSTWRCCLLVPPARPPSVLSWWGCNTQGYTPAHYNRFPVVPGFILRVWITTKPELARTSIRSLCSSAEIKAVELPRTCCKLELFPPDWLEPNLILTYKQIKDKYSRRDWIFIKQGH